MYCSANKFKIETYGQFILSCKIKWSSIQIAHESWTKDNKKYRTGNVRSWNRQKTQRDRQDREEDLNWILKVWKWTLALCWESYPDVNISTFS